MLRVCLRLLAAVSLIITAACSDSTGPAGTVSIRFVATIQGVTPSPPAAGVSLARDIDIGGTNGTLTITDLRLVVNEFELEGDDDDGEDDEGPFGDDDGDEDEFETGPFFVNVPVDGQPLTITNDQIPAGTYDEMEFEVEDFELDDASDDEDGAAILALLEDIRQEIADWPTEASMLVVGSFTPTGGSAIDFRTYFAAEIEIERDIQPPLVLGEADAKSVLVELDLGSWFKLPDGTVLDLSQFDFDTTGQVVEFELEFEDGVDVEVDD